jgi:hypothetical protein
MTPSPHEPMPDPDVQPPLDPDVPQPADDPDIQPVDSDVDPRPREPND